jgi:hypothetical protein
MTTFVERADSILQHMEGFEQRKKMEEDILQFYEKLNKINTTAPSVLVSIKFLSEISDNPKLNEQLQNLEIKYSEIRKQFVTLWGEDAGKIGISDTLAFFDPLQKYIESLKASDELIRTQIIDLQSKSQSDKAYFEGHKKIFTQMSSEPFKNREDFIFHMGRDYSSLNRYINGWTGIANKIRDWKKTSEEIKKEKQKVNFEDDKRINPKTREFLKLLSQSRNGVEFTLLEKEILNDMTKYYPDIVLKLRIRIAE